MTKKKIEITEKTEIISSLNCEVTMSVVGDTRVILVEPQDILLNVGDWYYGGLNCHWLILKSSPNSVECVGFFDGKWKSKFSISGLYSLIPADMSKVKELLIGEAVKRGFKEGIKIHRQDLTDEICTTQFEDLKGIYINKAGTVQCFGFKIFCPNTGKWAGIIKEPLYINEHGTEFFKGDEYWFICKSTRGMANSVMSDRKDPHGNDNYSFPMTERECHQYLADNWDKFKK